MERGRKSAKVGAITFLLNLVKDIRWITLLGERYTVDKFLGEIYIVDKFLDRFRQFRYFRTAPEFRIK